MSRVTAATQYAGNVATIAAVHRTQKLEFAASGYGVLAATRPDTARSANSAAALSRPDRESSERDVELEPPSPRPFVIPTAAEAALLLDSS